MLGDTSEHTNGQSKEEDLNNLLLASMTRLELAVHDLQTGQHDLAASVSSMHKAMRGSLHASGSEASENGDTWEDLSPMAGSMRSHRREGSRTESMAWGSMRRSQTSTSPQRTSLGRLERQDQSFDEYLGMAQQARHVSTLGSADAANSAATQEPTSTIATFRQQRQASSLLMLGHAESLPRDSSGFLAPTLPLFWPSSAKRHPAWQAPVNGIRLEAALEGLEATHAKSSGAMFSHESSKGSRPCCILHPGSFIRITLDMIATMVLIFELAMTPYVLAWEIEAKGIFIVLWWITIGFWCIDLIANFRTGFYHDGRVVLRGRSVFKNYLRGWFLMDFCLLGCDFASLMVSVTCEECTGGSRNLRLVRLTRILRCVTVLRASRLVPHIENFLENHTLGDKFSFLLWLCQMALLVVWGTHLLTCMWWSIGRRSAADTGNRWVEDVFDEKTYLDMSPGLQYTFAFHWALSQLCLGSSVVHARNVVEQLFTIVCLLVGLLLGTTLISLLSAEMVDSQMSSRQKTDQLKQMRRFLRQHGINQRQAASIQGLMQERIGYRQVPREEEFPGLQLLPQSVRMDLHFSICKSCLNMHPLFHTWLGLSESAAVRLCMDAVHLAHVRPGDEVFVAGERAHAAYGLRSGDGIYTQSPASAPVARDRSTPVPSGQLLAEGALWTDWIHVGTLASSDYAGVYSVTYKEFCQTVAQHAMLADTALEYSRLFHNRLRVAKPPRCDYPTDLGVPWTKWEELVFHMAPSVATAICMTAVAAYKEKFHVKLIQPQSRQQLEEEVRDGRAVVVLAGKGRKELRRVVSVVALRLESRQGLILVHVADVSPAGWVPVMQLPGGKQERGARELETLQRIIRSKLRPLEGKMTIMGMERADTEDESKKFGLTTKYLRTRCLGKLRSDCDIEQLSQVELNVVSASFRSVSYGMRHSRSEESTRVGAAERCRKSGFRAAVGRVSSAAWVGKKLSDLADGTTGIHRNLSGGSRTVSFPLGSAQMYCFKTAAASGIGSAGDSARKYSLYGWFSDSEFEYLAKCQRDNDPRILNYLGLLPFAEIEEAGELNENHVLTQVDEDESIEKRGSTPLSPRVQEMEEAEEDIAFEWTDIDC